MSWMTKRGALRKWLLLGIPAALLLGLMVLLPGRQALAEEVRIRPTQLTLTGNLELAEGKTLADGVLLMVHGTLAHHRMELIAALQKLLKERGVSTLAINLSLGFDARKGPYDCNQPMRHTHDDAMEEIAAWVAWLKDKGAKSVWLFGHSRGGNQVALYLLRKPDAVVKKAVLLAPMTHDARKAAAAYEKRFGVKLDAALQQAHAMQAARRGEAMAEWPGLLYCKDARGTPRSFLSYHAPRPAFDTPSLLKSLPVPVLVVAGTEDEIFPDLAERVKPLADGEKVKLVALDAGHFFRDFAAEDTADAIAAFLKE